MSPRVRNLVGTVLLLGVTVAWGSTFLVVKDAIGQLPTMAFLTYRFAISAVLLIAIRPAAVLRLPKPQYKHGILLGLVLGGGYITQTVGLETTPASVSGFITGMFVVFTPLLAWVLTRTRIEPIVWLALVMSTAGLAMISLRGFGVSGGDLITLASAAFFALQILGLERWSKASDAYGLVVVQLTTVAVMCLAFAPLRGGLPAPRSGDVWWALALTAVAATAAAFLIQTWVQSFLPATRAAFIMTMEPVFAGIFGVLVGDERVTLIMIAGSILMFGAMLLTEIGPRRSAEAAIAHLEP